jgi:hypothetical protein
MSDVSEFQTSANAVIDQVFTNLEKNTNVKLDGPTRLFFPAGIQLIFVKISLLNGITVEAQISGATGPINPMLNEVAEAPASLEAPVPE